MESLWLDVEVLWEAMQYISVNEVLVDHLLF